MMDVSIFDIVGPIMLGPSSSGTAGMVRIGSIARAFLQGEPRHVEMQFHPRYDHYAGCRSHLGLMGGLMGFAADDPRFPAAFEEARERGIEWEISRFPAEESEDTLRVRLAVDTGDGTHHRLCAVSAGGGSVRVESVDEIPIDVNNFDAHIFVWADRDVRAALASLLGEPMQAGEQGGKWLYYKAWDRKEKELLAALCRTPGVTRAAWIPAFLEGGSTGKAPLFQDFSQLTELCETQNAAVSEIMLTYEAERSGRSPEAIRENMKNMWRCMKDSVSSGITGQNRPLYGLDDGENGLRMLTAAEEGKTLSGGVLGRAIAYGLGVMESAMGMGCIAAAPTCGSSGIMPGCLVSVQQAYGYTDEQITDALFSSTFIGVVMAYDGVRFSGVAAGCQGEITVSAAMAASALAYLGGGDLRCIGDAACFAVKGLLGLVCDPLGCVEVPCIKRNGAGIAAAMASADMALAGIHSYITPDDASLALKDVQDHLPEYLRGGGGGTACTPAARRARAHLEAVDEAYMQATLR